MEANRAGEIGDFSTIKSTGCTSKSRDKYWVCQFNRRKRVSRAGERERKKNQFSLLANKANNHNMLAKNLV